jgi:hypothetical protein
MSDPRDDLVALIEETITPLTRGLPDFYGEAFTATADAILAAGWRPPTEHLHRWHVQPKGVVALCVDCGEPITPEMQALLDEATKP